MQEGCLSRRLRNIVCGEKRFCSASRKGSSRRDFIAVFSCLMLDYIEDGARCYSMVHSGRMRSIRHQLQQGKYQLDVGRSFVRVVKCWDRFPREGMESPSSGLSKLTWT